LQSVGFVDSGKVDPFDGGPHWEAVTDEISLVRGAQWCLVEAGAVDEAGVAGIVARVGTHARADEGWFRAVWTHVRDRRGSGEPPRRVKVPAQDLAALRLADADEQVLVALRPQHRVTSPPA
jgi:arginine N-succinyltransferase